MIIWKSCWEYSSGEPIFCTTRSISYLQTEAQNIRLHQSNSNIKDSVLYKTAVQRKTNKVFYIGKEAEYFLRFLRFASTMISVSSCIYVWFHSAFQNIFVTYKQAH